MTWIGGKTPGRIWVGGKAVAMLLTATCKVWEAVRSCFGSGFWRCVKGWSETEKWKE